ncbi:MAG: hypothetical protein HOV97_05190 [Nonomuraea sp.]|nr:hypothetical protein [Nonomuraea sp.]
MTQTPTSPASNNPYGVTLHTVITPSGSDLDLQTQEEAIRYEQVRDQYLKDNAFPNVSDLQDLDRLLVFEIVIYRWQLWLSRGFDYQMSRIDEGAIKSFIKEYSTEVRLLKLALGIDKATRDKEKGESLADYVAKLLERAKVFGYHRNRQYEKAVTAFWQLRSMVMTYDRCDEEERTHLDLSPDSIIEWFRDNVIKDWDAMEESFRKDQSMWIRDM